MLTRTFEFPQDTIGLWLDQWFDRTISLDGGGPIARLPHMVRLSDGFALTGIRFRLLDTTVSRHSLVEWVAFSWVFDPITGDHTVKLNPPSSRLDLGRSVDRDSLRSLTLFGGSMSEPVNTVTIMTGQNGYQSSTPVFIPPVGRPIPEPVFHSRVLAKGVLPPDAYWAQTDSPYFDSREETWVRVVDYTLEIGNAPVGKAPDRPRLSFDLTDAAKPPPSADPGHVTGSRQSYVLGVRISPDGLTATAMIGHVRVTSEIGRWSSTRPSMANIPRHVSDEPETFNYTQELLRVENSPKIRISHVTVVTVDLE